MENIGGFSKLKIIGLDQDLHKRPLHERNDELTAKALIIKLSVLYNKTVSLLKMLEFPLIS